MTPVGGVRWGLVAATGAAALLAWLVTPELASPARLLTVFLLSVFPALLLAQARMVEAIPLDQVSRGGLYLSSSIALWVLALISVAAALASGFTLETLGLVPLPVLPLLGWTGAVLLVAGVLIGMGQLSRTPETPLLDHLLPRTPGEKLAFVGVSFTAGVCEELVFRGFLIPALTVALGSVWVAALLSSAVFGLLHSYQGRIGILRTGLLGFALAVPFLVTGSVLPSMLAHFLLDLIVGLWLGDWLLRRSARSA